MLVLGGEHRWDLEILFYLANLLREIQLQDLILLLFDGWRMSELSRPRQCQCWFRKVLHFLRLRALKHRVLAKRVWRQELERLNFLPFPRRHRVLLSAVGDCAFPFILILVLLSLFLVGIFDWAGLQLWGKILVTANGLHEAF